MVHVTFNEKVERHQYTPTPSIDEGQGTDVNGERNNTEELASAISQGQTRLNYDRTFLKNLQGCPLAQVCPDVVKKGIETGAGWAPTRTIGKGSVFSKPFTYNSRIQGRPLTRFYPNNQNFGDEIFTPIEPIGHNRFDIQSRNYQSRNYQQNYSNFDDFQNRNFQSGFGQRSEFHSNEVKNTQEEDTEPEWYKAGPTSRNDFVELHGFDENNEHQAKFGHFGCEEANISGGANSGASSHNSSPPAKSTPAKVTPSSLKNDSQRNKRPGLGRSNNWQNNFDNRQYGPNPFINEFFKNFSATQNKSNVQGLPPFVRVEDVESALIIERMKFRQMVAQIQNQPHYINPLYQRQEPVPSAKQILKEIEKILRTNPDPNFKRPEVRTLTNNIVEAVIPPMNLMNILKNPLTEPQNRETIVAALKLINQAKENATNAIKMHTPTESELRAHMDAILQDAIIKKRMENLNLELLKMPQQSGRGFPNQPQSFQQMFQSNFAGRPHNFSQNVSRGQAQQVENGPAMSRDLTNNILNRWLPQTLLNKAYGGELPELPIGESLRSEELESSIKQKLKVLDKDVK